METMDTRKPAAVDGGAAWLLPLLEDGVRPGRVLVIGGGLVEEVALLAGKGFRVRVVDPSREALSKVPTHGDVQTIQADLLSMDPGLAGALDLVVERGFLASLDPVRRADWVFAVTRLLPRAGLLAGLFLLGHGNGAAPHPLREGELLKLLSRTFVAVSVDDVEPPRPGRAHHARGLFRRK
jgi:hypothetical protein